MDVESHAGTEGRHEDDATQFMHEALSTPKRSLNAISELHELSRTRSRASLGQVAGVAAARGGAAAAGGVGAGAGAGAAARGLDGDGDAEDSSKQLLQGYASDDSDLLPEEMDEANGSHTAATAATSSSAALLHSLATNEVTPETAVPATTRLSLSHRRHSMVRIQPVLLDGDGEQVDDDDGDDEEDEEEAGEEADEAEGAEEGGESAGGKEAEAATTRVAGVDVHVDAVVEADENVDADSDNDSAPAPPPSSVGTRNLSMRSGGASSTAPDGLSVDVDWLQLKYMDIANIHAMRKALDAVRKARAQP